LVIGLLAIFLLAYAAEITWRFLPEPKNTIAKQSNLGHAVHSGSGKVQLDLVSIKRLNLFGDLSAEPVIEEQITDAPVTKLNLTLTGVVSSSLKDQGVAIIENRGTQETYGVGEKISGTNATLKEVYADRVIIRNGPSSETLMLDGIDYTKPSSGQVAESSGAQITKSQSDNRQNQIQRRTLSEEALQASRQLQQQPANFTDFIAITPHRPDGELQGYRVSPGKNPALFKSAGLKSGDVVTEINGLDLTDMQQSLEAMNVLRDLQSLQMTISRKGDLLTIYLDLPSGEQEI
jgi:general secretion pathway protein C